jgi:hypothetical protein
MTDGDGGSDSQEVFRMAANSAVALLRQQYQDSRGWSEGTVEGLTDEQANW